MPNNSPVPGQVTIDNRAFQVLGIEPSRREHFEFTDRVTEECGLHGLVPTPGETEREYVARAYKAAVLRGRPIFNFLGTVLLPVGMSPEQWTPALALANGEFFATRTEMRDKVLLQSVLHHLFLTFGGKFYRVFATLTAPVPAPRWIN